MTFFTRSGTAYEPQFALVRSDRTSGHSTQIALAGQVAQFSQPDASRPATYGFLTLGMLGGVGSGGSGSSYQLGGGVGYRTLYRSTLGVRVEARYRRWFDETPYGLNEFSILLGLGALLGSG